MKNPELFTANGNPESLSSLYNNDNCSVIAIQDAIEDSRTGEELVKNMNKLKLLYKFGLDRETPEYVRLSGTDYLGNRHYFKAEKS